MADERVCENMGCKYYENGYCLAFGWPVSDVGVCDEQTAWKNENEDDGK